MRTSRRIQIAALAVLGVISSSFASTDTFYVNGDCGNDAWSGKSQVCDEPDGPKATIQAGINAAADDDDEVVVANGTYTGEGNRDLDCNGKLITVRSENGPEDCVIDCAANANDPHRGFYFHTGESSETILEGFTITNGFSPSSPVGRRGGAILCIGSSPTIRQCTIRLCTADIGGGGLANMSGSSPVVIGCTFVSNDAGRGNGGGVFNRFSSSPTVIGCSFSGNASGHVGGALASRDDSHPFVVNCSFVGNSAQLWGGAVRAGFDSISTFVGCTFSANSAVSAGGAVSAGSDSNVPLRTTTLINCVFWENSSPLGPQIALLGNFPAEIAVSFTDVMGGRAGVYVKNGFRLTWGEGNIDADPLFVDPDNGDYHLKPGSPCIDAADNTAVPDGIETDLDGNPRFVDDPDTEDTGKGDPPIVDMGAYELQAACDPCDTNCDGSVDLTDIEPFIDCFICGEPCSPCAGDTNGDGSIDLADVEGFIECLLR